jgi:hypothetical protein
MKKTLVALAVLASGSVFAQVSATSLVTGTSASWSAASGNQVSTQAADATSANFAGATGNRVNAMWSASSGSTTETSGFTHAAALAGGSGPGFSFSEGVQAGNAMSGPNTGTATGSGHPTGGFIVTNSFSEIATGSTARVGSPPSDAFVGSAPGTANGTSFAVARNNTSGIISAPLPGNTSAQGVTFGQTIMNMAIPSAGSGAASSTGLSGGDPSVGARQNGDYIGTITRP